MIVFAKRKISRVLVTVAAFLLILTVSGWVLASYIWHPSIDDIDINVVTKEADELFSHCTDEADANSSLHKYVWVEPEIIPYLFALYARGRSF